MQNHRKRSPALHKPFMLPFRRALAVEFLFAAMIPSVLGLFFASVFWDSRGTVVGLAAILLYLSSWFVLKERQVYRSVTLASCFVAVTAFIFCARAIYICVAMDFSIVGAFGFPSEWSYVNEALNWVILAVLAYVLGSLVVSRWAEKSLDTAARPLRSRLYEVRELYCVLAVQCLGLLCLLPFGLTSERASLTHVSSNAYVYLLPTLLHGVNLYSVAVFSEAAKRRFTYFRLAMLLCSVVVVLADAFLLYNMSQFRGFYIVGILATVTCLLRVFSGRVSVIALVALFVVYPVFKQLGSDRSLSNREVVETVLLKPAEAYSDEGLETAFGMATDLNMLDTLVASLNWDHSHYPYALSYLYVFVHFVPRSIWVNKPIGGFLTDTSYTLGKPYSPGVIGFLNDDGGRLYMLGAMFLLGLSTRGCESLCFRIRARELQNSVWSAMFLSSLVSTRYLPYQVFYGFLVFFIPTVALHIVRLKFW